MLTIPAEVQNLFKLDSCKKNFHVHFPNGEMADLNNENFREESVEFTESICSQNTFKFGLSESSEIQFETVGVGNILGAKIECGIEADCSSLGTDWIAEHPVDDTLPFLTPQTTLVRVDDDKTNQVVGNVLQDQNYGFDTIESLSVPITPTQDLNGYSKPWAGGTGKNILPDNYVGTTDGDTSHVTFTKNADGSVVVASSGAATRATYYRMFDDRFGLPLFKLPPGDYTLSAGTDAPGIFIFITLVNNGTVVQKDIARSDIKPNFTIPADLTYTNVRMAIDVLAGNTVNTTVYPMIRLQTVTDATWEPYENECSITGITGLTLYVSDEHEVEDATAYAATWQSEAGTVYSGKYFPLTGQLIADRVLYSTTWSAGGSATTYGNCTRKRFTFTDADDKSKKTDAICNLAVYIPEDTSAGWAKGSVFSIHNSNKYLYLSLPTSTDGATPIQLCYYLATPVTYTLTEQDIALLPGQNYIWSDIDATMTAEIKKPGVRMYYRVPYGLFTVKSCPRDHQAITHRRVTAYTDTRFLTSPYQEKLLAAKSVSEKYTPSFSMIQFAIGANGNEQALLDSGLTKTAIGTMMAGDDATVTKQTGYVDGSTISMTIYAYCKRWSVSDKQSTPVFHPLPKNKLYGIVGIEKIESANLFDQIAAKLVSDYGVPESVAYNSARYPANILASKMIAFETETSVSGQTVKNDYWDLTKRVGFVCMNPDREDITTNIIVVRSARVTLVSSGTTLADFEINVDGLGDAYLYQYEFPQAISDSDFELTLTPTGTEKVGNKTLNTFSNSIDLSSLLNGYYEASAQFSIAGRDAKNRLFRLSDTVDKTLEPGDYSEFWMDEYNVSGIGKVKYTLSDDGKQNEMVYDFSEGQSVYNMTGNIIFEKMNKKKADVESYLDTFFIPYIDTVKFDPIEMTIRNGLPFLEAGDCIEAVAEDEVTAKTYVLSQRITGIQTLIQEIESSGGDLMQITEESGVVSDE